jgi:hypothetical protein
MFKLKINLDCHGPRPFSNIRLLPDPHCFSFPPTFKRQLLPWRNAYRKPLITSKNLFSSFMGSRSRPANHCAYPPFLISCPPHIQLGGPASQVEGPLLRLLHARIQSGDQRAIHSDISVTPAEQVRPNILSSALHTTIYRMQGIVSCDRYFFQKIFLCLKL